MELQSEADELEERGINLVTISYDFREVLRAFTGQHGITYTMLSDPESRVIERFDLLNPVPTWAIGENADDPEVRDAASTYVSVVNPSERMVGIAFPGTFILDAEGRVIERYFEDFYIERNTISSILLRLGENVEPVEATEVSTAQLELTTYPSSSELAPGNRFALVLDIAPGPGMHIYAPGAPDDYQVVRVNIEPQPFLELLPVEYPQSGMYYFEPFDETVPVYEEPLTLLQEVVLKGDLESQGMLRGRESVTINGTLEYQACDDAICYVPSSIPLSWTMRLRPLVFQPTTGQ